MGLVVVGDERAVWLHAQLPVEPDAGGQGEQALDDPGVDPGRGATTMLFQAKLAFEGVDDRLDPLAHRPQRPEPGRLVAAVGTHQHRAQARDVPSTSAPARPLSTMRAWPGWRLARSSKAMATSRSPSLGLARHQATGLPSGVVRTYSLSPQYQREGLGHQP
jgi:hypothetical protein